MTPCLDSRIEARSAECPATTWKAPRTLKQVAPSLCWLIQVFVIENLPQHSQQNSVKCGLPIWQSFFGKQTFSFVVPILEAFNTGRSTPIIDGNIDESPLWGLGDTPNPHERTFVKNQCEDNDCKDCEDTEDDSLDLQQFIDGCATPKKRKTKPKNPRWRTKEGYQRLKSECAKRSCRLEITLDEWIALAPTKKTIVPISCIHFGVDVARGYLEYICKRIRSRHAAGHNMVRYIALDVECVANGRGHSARIPATVSLVDHDGKVLQDAKIAVDNVHSYLTPLTGLSPSYFADARPLSTVLAETHALLGPDVVLVGQHPKSDIDWLQLKEGTHYKEVIDIAHFFKQLNRRYANYSFRSLQHTAQELLKIDMSGSHSATKDALASMKLYRLYTEADTGRKQSMVKQVHSGRQPVSVAKQHNYSIDGVCLAAFNRRSCTCNDPILASIP